ncbi:hypothetical protein TURU_129343 [Turdus rufiventris]|nr:hypothetical protein TURU_129343 [Turdus rufiventris]
MDPHNSQQLSFVAWIEIKVFLFFEQQENQLPCDKVNTLFNIWIKYKPRLPEWYYNERLVKVGDALAQIKEYKLALLQCYERYLQQFVSVNLDDVMDDVNRFKSTFFPNGVRDKKAALTIFARRGLIKIDEVKQLEDTSSLKHTETAKIFREATLKMAVMIFKRAVYVSRGKSSSVRPEPKVNPRKAVKLSWPRTTTERLLVEMFDGAAAQFLAILEALSDSRRNLFPPHPPAPDESEICVVTSELFSAGLEILSGGETNSTSQFGIINPSSTLLQLMLTGEKGVSGDAAVKFVKLAFSYEEWKVFYSALEFVDNFLQAQDDPTWKKPEIELKLLTLMQPLIFPGKFERSFSATDYNKKKASRLQGSEKTDTIRKESLKPRDSFQDLMILATTVFSCVSTSDQWVHILWIMNEIIEKSNIADTNVMFAEITSCLAAILENVAESTSESKEKGGGSASLSQDETCDQPEILMKTPTEQLQIAYEILEKAINDMNTSRLMTLLPDGKSIFDNCCTKVYSNDRSLNPVLGRGNDKRGGDSAFVTDLHLELIQAQHRVAVKLLKITQEELIMKKIKRNKLSRAIFLMQKAAQKFPEDLTTTSQRQLLEEALTLIEEVEAEQSALYRSLKETMRSKKKSRTPPPPLLLSRSHCSMTFKPAPFDSDIQVSWYCILGCVAGGSNMKVRLNSNKLQNSGEQIPANGKILLEVEGLDANEKYIFAVAAYSSDGKLIGDAVGQMTKPILAYPPLSATTVRAYLTQVAYQTGNFRLARAAFSPMWDYFVSDSSRLPPNAAAISASSNLTVSEKRLRFEAVSQTSPITLHLFLRNIFAVSDINVMEGALFCDSICSNEILYKEQVARLAECERMIVAIELSNWLNDASYTLQSVVQCYGLLAPLIYHKIFSVPVVQILIKCLATLQEIPSAILQRRQEGCYESIQHMITCTSYHTAKKYSSRTSHLAAMAKAAENLITLESSLLKLTEPGTGTQLTGKEGPLFLYPVISCWTSERAYKEVLKFRGQTRFLEFFVQLLRKVLNEEKFQCVLEWADGVEDYMRRKGKDKLKKLALQTLVMLLTKYVTRSKFCQMCLEEMPWKSQMNIYLAVAHYHLFKKKLEEQYNIGIRVSHHLDSYNILDPEIFSLNNSGTVLAREAVEDNIGKPTPPLLEKSEVTETKTSVKSPKKRNKQSQSSRSRSTKTSEEQDAFQSNTLLLKHFTSIFLHLKRAVVLAHRGGHWTLLQNACRELWNYTQEFQLIANQSHSFTDTFPITWDFLWSTIWLPFYFASDMMIDMIIDLQASSSLKIVDPEGDFCIPSCLGGIADEKGGSNLHPQPPLDDVNVVDLRWICNLILKTIELLYQMKKWEALVHIAVQFNIFTHERFTEQVSPLLVYAQRQLLERIQQFSGPDSHESHFTKYLSDDAQKTLFRASLPHPVSDYDFVQYETNILIPGIDLFSDRYRADISTVVASLNFIMFELHCAKQNLIALQKFDSSEPLLTVTNLKVLEDTFNWSLSLTLVSLCTQQIMNKLTLAKMHLIICLSATINNIPEKVEKAVYSLDISLPEPNKTTASTVKGDADQNLRQQEQRDRMVHFVDCKDELNMAMLKGILLTEAEESLRYLIQDIQEKYDGDISRYSVEDLEAIIEAKLELACISQQRYQAALSIALAFSAIRLLQDAKVFSMDVAHFQEEKDEREYLESTTEGVQLPPRTTAQGHVNARLWLRCRATLVTALVTQIHSFGGMKGSAVVERRHVIKEVILEAEAFGDIETQAEVMVQAAILDLREKRPVADVKLLLQIFDCGELIERQIEDSTLTSLVLPMKNIYLPHINLLAQVKMKIGKTERQIAETGSNKSSQAVETLLEAIKLSQQYDQKYELIKQSYLEIALSYLYFAKDNEHLSESDELVPSKSSSSYGEQSSEEAIKSEVYQVQAWVAIRAAAQVSDAVHASQLLIGMKSVKDWNMKDEVQQKIPEFAYMDLFSSYRDFISDGYNVVPETPEVSSTENKQITEDHQSESEEIESLVTKASLRKDTITWVDMIRYHNHLKRIYNTTLSEECERTESKAARAQDKEISVQWYIPSLAKPSNNTETKVLLLYAYNTNPVRTGDIAVFSTSVFSGYLWIPLARIISLREKLSDLKEQLEILMQSSKNFSTSVPPSFLEQSETLKISYSNKPRMGDAKVHLDKKTEIPFDVTLQSITSLEDMFDVVNGCIITEENLLDWIISLLH